MLALIIADIIGNKLFNHPVPGAIEVVAFLGVIVTALAIAFTYHLRGHIQVEFFILRLPPRLQTGIGLVVRILGMALFVLLAWRSYEYARVLQSTGEVSMTRGIPFYPFVYALGFSCIPVFLLLLLEFVKMIMKLVRK